MPRGADTFLRAEQAEEACPGEAPGASRELGTAAHRAGGSVAKGRARWQGPKVETRQPRP